MIKKPGEVFNEYAHEYEERFMDVSRYAPDLDFFLEFLPDQNISLLDIGCGPGNLSKYLFDKNLRLKITGTDLSENMVQLAKKNIPQGEFMVMDCRNITSLATEYTAVVIGFLTPYLDKHETKTLLKDVNELLTNQGLLLLSTICDAYEKSGLQTNSKGDQVHQYFYNEDILIPMLKDAGFDLLH